MDDLMLEERASSGNGLMFVVASNNRGLWEMQISSVSGRERKGNIAECVVQSVGIRCVLGMLASLSTARKRLQKVNAYRR